jgi:hypothetical protein
MGCCFCKDTSTNKEDTSCQYCEPLGHNKTPVGVSEGQFLDDQATIFVLAGAMISTLQLSHAKDKTGFVNLLSKVSKVLAFDPSFIKRFQAEQKAVMYEFNKIASPTEAP